MKIRKMDKMDDFGGTPRAPWLQTPPILFFSLVHHVLPIFSNSNRCLLSSVNTETPRTHGAHGSNMQHMEPMHTVITVVRVISVIRKVESEDDVVLVFVDPSSEEGLGNSTILTFHSWSWWIYVNLTLFLCHSRKCESVCYPIAHVYLMFSRFLHQRSLWISCL